MQNKLTLGQRIRFAFLLFVIMPLGVTSFWYLGTVNNVLGALYVIPIVGYGLNLILIFLVATGQITRRIE